MGAISARQGAQRTLTQALEAANKVTEEYSRRIVLQGCAEVKGRLDAYVRRTPEPPTVTPPPATAPKAWVRVNTAQLNTPFFLDLAAWLKTLPANESKMWESMKEMGFKMMEVHDLTGRMLKEQERRDLASAATLPDGLLEAQDTEQEGTATAVPALPLKASTAKEFTYQGRQLSLEPGALFDITGKVARADAIVSEYPSGPLFAVSVVLKGAAVQELQAFTERNLDHEVGLIHQGRLFMVAVIREPIANGVLQISGDIATIEDAKKFAAELSSS